MPAHIITYIFIRYILLADETKMYAKFAVMMTEKIAQDAMVVPNTSMQTALELIYLNCFVSLSSSVLVKG